MDPNQLVKDTASKLDISIDHLKDELKKIRTGRAHPSMIDSLVVLAYGQPMPLIQLATVTVPEPQLLQITPFDASNLQAITTAIRDNQSLGLNPMDDGRVVRVPIPALNTERRQQIVKQLGEKSEECMVSLRATRHEALKRAENGKKEKQISEDDYSRIQKQIDELMLQQKNEVEKLIKTKESEIMTV